MEARASGLTRRQLFTRGALATLGVLFALPAVRLSRYMGCASAPGLAALTCREQDILRALLLSFFPGGEMPKADPDRLILAIDEHLQDAAQDARMLFRAMLHVVEDQPLLLRGARFTQLSMDARFAEVRAWEVTPIYLKRMAFQSLKLICAMFYAEQPEVKEAIGWYLGCTPVHLRPSPVGV